MKSGAKHVLKCFCLVSAFIAQSAPGGGWEDTKCAAVSPIKKFQGPPEVFKSNYG